MLDGYVKETGSMINDIKGMPAFKGDSSLRDAAVNIFGFYKKIFDNDYRDVIHLRKELLVRAHPHSSLGVLLALIVSWGVRR